MASLIPSGDIAGLTGALMDHFDTFKREIVVVKEPLQTIVNEAENTYPGYGPTSTTTVLTPVSGVFYAMKVRAGAGSQPFIVPETNITAYSNSIRIKVEPATKDYIINGKTEHVIFDGLLYNTVSLPIPQNYLGLIFYYFDLGRTL